MTPCKIKEILKQNKIKDDSDRTLVKAKLDKLSRTGLTSIKPAL